METPESNRLSLLVSNNTANTDSSAYKPRRRPRSILVEIEEPATKKQGCSRFEKFLILVIALMLIFCVVLLCLYLNERQRNDALKDVARVAGNQTTKNESYKAAKIWSQICWSADCIHTASELLTSIDPTANPCEDFYQYACGGWIKNNIRPEANPKWDQFYKLTKKNNALINRLINSEEIRKQYHKDEAVTKAFQFYDSCMNKTEIERLGDEPLTQIIKKYGSWAVIDKNWDENKWDFMSNFITAHRELAISPLLSIYVDVDIKNSSYNIIYLDQSYLGISSSVYTGKSKRYNKMRMVYKELMTNLTLMLGGDSDSLKDVQEIYEFEKNLSKIIERQSSSSDNNKNYKRITVRQLQEATGPEIDWLRFLRGIFKDATHKVTQEEQVAVFALNYLKKLVKLIDKTPKRLLSNYIMWRFIKIQYYQLSKEYERVFQNYYTRTFNFWRDSSRKELCLSSLTDHFGMPVSKVYLDRKFKGKSKALAQEISESIRRVFIDKLKAIEWMDSVTKKEAKAKAQTLLENIGYPDYVMDSKHLASIYRKVPISSKTYFMNLLNLRTNDNIRNFASLGKPFDKKEWPFPPTMLNAYYSYNNNKMVFPAGILQAPFYDLKYPRAVNYGAIGTIMAHELTHGFDVTGKDYNKDGNNIKWWTNYTIGNFNNRSQCLVDQYNNFTFYGLQVDGKLTLSENIADNGGVKQAFEAYQNWVRTNGEEPRLPGVMLTNEQIFFFSFARNWCGKLSDEAGMMSLAWDEHAPMSWRVNGSLRNFKKFAEHFNCPVGSPMNPEKKCAVW